MKQKLFALLLLLGQALCRAGAQEEKPLIAFTPFFADGVSAEESQLIETLVRSYLADMGDLVSRLESSPNQDAGRPPDYTIRGHIQLDRDGHLFLLEIVNTRTSEVYSASSVCKSMGELALRARSVLETAFADSMESVPRTAAAAETPEAISENLVIGAWKGEAGIEMVHLRRDGRGVAIFSSGAQMVLSYAVENNILKIWQVSPNSERFYYPLPQNAAKRLAEGAEPMRWEMSLFKRGSVLEGVKQATAVRMENGSAAALVPGGDVRQVQWTKAGH